MLYSKGGDLSTTRRDLSSPRAGRLHRLRQAGVLSASAALMLSMTAAPALARPGDATRDGVTSASTSSATSTTQDVRVLVFHGDPAEQEDPVLEAADTASERSAQHGKRVRGPQDRSRLPSA